MARKTPQKILAKQVDLLYRQLPFSLLTTATVSLLFLFFLRDFPNPTALRIWVAMMMLVILFRTFSAVFYHNRKKQSFFHVKQAEKLFIAGAALTGMTWGTLACWIYPMTNDMGSHLLIFIVVVGIPGGSIVTLSYRKLPSYLFVILTILPMLIGLYRTPGSQNVAIGLVLIIYTLFLLKNARIFQENNEQMLILKEKALVREKNLRNSRKKAEEASRAKSDFLANMSHEIRTPMNAIIGMTRLVQGTELNDEQKKYLGRIETSSTMLLGILNGILDFSKIEAGQLLLEKRPFLITQLLDTVHSTMIALAREKELTFFIDCADNVPEAFIGDSTRLGQVLVNLVGNAIKFTEQGDVVVKIGLGETYNETEKCVLLFSVQDTGIGITKDRLDSLFRSFQQADSSIARRYGGTGLGLAISRQLVQLMGGDIIVDSKESIGSTFSFTIELEPCSRKAVQQVCELDVSGPCRVTGLKVLLVEDNEANSELGTIILEKSGQTVQVAENGLLALGVLARESFDVVLMDVQMPEMDGVTATRIIRAVEQGNEPMTVLPGQLISELRKQLAGKHTPVIAMTANAMDSDRRHCLDAGMDEYLTKPFQPEQVMATLQRFSSTGGQFSSADDPAEKRKRGKSKFSGQGTATVTKKVEEHLARTYKLNSAQVEQMIVASSQSILTSLEKAENCLSTNDLKMLGSAAHALKGNLLNLGLKSCAETAAKIEISAKTGESQPYKQWLAAIRIGVMDLMNDSAERNAGFAESS